jgi:pimeloyl-ACP methyl ester carboxylesterase
MAYPLKTHQTAIFRFFLGVFLLPAAGVFSQSFPAQPTPSIAAAKSRLNALSVSLQAKPTDAAGLVEWTNAQLYLRKARVLLSLYASAYNLDYFVSRELRNAEESLSRIRSKQPLPWIVGLREEGYYSDNDASFQPFVRYLPAAASPGKKLPLLVFLHGYNPAMDLVNWQGIPQPLVDFAETEGFYIAAPFGRGNTDFQGIGEQDVLTVIAEMSKRYAVDENRIVLTGYSMGGTGVWMIGARYPELFAGLFIVSGRGDYYAWHKVNRGDLPAYKQRIVDTEFAGSLVRNLQSIPIFCVHGALDGAVPVEEARVMAEAVRKVNPGLIYIELEEDGHGILDETLVRPDVQAWLRQCRRNSASSAPVHPGYNRIPGTNGPVQAQGPIKEAFLSPYIFILAGNPGDARQSAPFRQAVTDWYRFSKAVPRMAAEPDVAPAGLGSLNVFLFGEPENSPLIRTVLADSPVSVTASSFVVGRRSFPRKGNGLYLARPSPWNPRKLAVVQCGAPWGGSLPENHKYDGLPDYIVYAATCDADGSNTPLCAGFFDENGQLSD